MPRNNSYSLKEETFGLYDLILNIIKNNKLIIKRILLLNKEKKYFHSIKSYKNKFYKLYFKNIFILFLIKK